MSYASPYSEPIESTDPNAAELEAEAKKKKSARIKKAAKIAGGIGLAAVAAGVGYGAYRYMKKKKAKEEGEGSSNESSDEEPEKFGDPEYELQEYSVRGQRVSSTPEDDFPYGQVGSAPFRDLGGEPMWVGSIYHEDSVQPGKISPHFDTKIRFGYGGQELGHCEKFDILLISEDMEWVDASHSQIPEGRRPVIGGYDHDNSPLYHISVYLEEHDISIPGKVGPGLTLGTVAWGGGEVGHENYKLLCWRD